ncbi:MAG: CocE/NonD family hydrolase [Planctomycetaceae bacterium]|nr:CocE/NonD family hydrolase [Planctomycetaceae bacterium]
MQATRYRQLLLTRTGFPFGSRPLRLLWVCYLAVVIFSSGSARSYADETPYDIKVETEIMVPMRDGVKLATDIYLPARGEKVAEGRLPVILFRTPYGKSGMGKSTARHFVRLGYAVIGQDTRGRGGSEGIWHWMSDDRDDGYDAVEWVAAQPWSNGKVGMLGCSYVGATQHLAAMTRPPHLTTIIPSNPSINHGIGATIYGGAFRLRVWKWVIGNVVNGSRQSRDPDLKKALQEQATQWQHYLMNLPLRRGLTPLRIAPEYENMLIEMMEHRRNDEYWRFSNIIEYVDEHKDIPTLMVGGWYDLFSSSTTETYMALKKSKQSPVHLIMGPWKHCGHNQAHGQVDFGPDAAVSKMSFHQAWFDRWMKDSTSDFEQKPPFQSPVRLFVMGSGDGHKTKSGKLYHGGYWRDEPDYPLPQARPTNFYLQPGGNLSPEIPAQSAAATAFEFDPKNPVPTIGGCVVGSNTLMQDGAWNQWGGDHTWSWPVPLPLSARNDVVVFMTPPLEQDLEVVGPIQVKLWASSSAVDTDFTAKLIDVYPSSADFPAGFDLIMGDGIIRARYRDSDKQETLMTPGETYEFTIKLDPCSNRFKKGHRIRVDISSSNFPRFDVNPNTGEPPADARRKITATNTIYHNSQHPSHIILPVIPAGK